METLSLALSLPSQQLAELEAAYAQPPRAYHNFAHVQALLHHYRDVADGPGWKQPREVALAVLYHDAIYEAGRSDNELRSAQLAVAAIGQWLPDAGVDASRVAELIELTARHGQLRAEELDADAALFLDSDMAILGAPPAVFDAYDRGIAQEYSGKVPGFLFRINRRRFLKGVLAQPRIFFSDYFHERYDAAARANLRRITS
ncbi:MAG: HD domain-containing protein [Stenotrophomonas sp.]|uniref:HD domain-containing protein n=1 Tax=Stenotrophomonas sp. TaxID=69392 RepID=UPI003D6D6B53